MAENSWFQTVENQNERVQPYVGNPPAPRNFLKFTDNHFGLRYRQPTPRPSNRKAGSWPLWVKNAFQMFLSSFMAFRVLLKPEGASLACFFPFRVFLSSESNKVGLLAMSGCGSKCHAVNFDALFSLPSKLPFSTQHSNVYFGWCCTRVANRDIKAVKIQAPN